jgi:hypothetical protein
LRPRTSPRCVPAATSRPLALPTRPVPVTELPPRIGAGILAKAPPSASPSHPRRSRGARSVAALPRAPSHQLVIRPASNAPSSPRARSGSPGFIQATKRSFRPVQVCGLFTAGERTAGLNSPNRESAVEA